MTQQKLTAETQRRREKLNFYSASLRLCGEKGRLLLAVLGPLILLAGVPSWAEEIDRLLAAVNGKVITQGDLRLARNLNAVSALGSRGALRTVDEEVNRLVELELLRQELENFPAIRKDENGVEAKMEDLRNAYAEIGGLPALLIRLGLQEAELRSYVALQASVLRFIDYRFRPFIVVSPEEKQAYYMEKLLPRLKESRVSQIPSLEEVSARIEEILIEEKVNQALNRWLLDIRRHARIEFFKEEMAPGGSQP